MSNSVTFADLIDGLTRYLSSESWVVQVFLVVLLTLTLDLAQTRLLGRLESQLKGTKTFWDEAFIAAGRKPLRALAWLVGLSYAITIAQAAKPNPIFEAVGPLRDVGVIAALAWFLYRFIGRAKRGYIAASYADGRRVDLTTADAIAKLLRLAVIITATLVVLQTLGYSISGVLAFGGIGGIAVGFAAKDLLANFFGGMMIYLDRPFNVGDWIRSPERDIEGTVTRIGWRLTEIRTFDKRPLYVPNGVFTQIAVENPSRMSNRRIYETIGIRYEDVSKMAAIVADVKQMLLDHEEIDTRQTLIVNFNAFAPSSLDFFVYTFTKTSEWIRYHEIKQDVLLKIINIIEGHDAEIAFPTSTIHIEAPLATDDPAAEALVRDVAK